MRSCREEQKSIWNVGVAFFQQTCQYLLLFVRLISMQQIVGAVCPLDFNRSTNITFMRLNCLMDQPSKDPSEIETYISCFQIPILQIVGPRTELTIIWSRLVPLSSLLSEITAANIEMAAPKRSTRFRD